MSVLGWVVLGLVIAVDAHALFALAVGARAATLLPELQRHARRTGQSALLLVLTGLPMSSLGVYLAFPQAEQASADVRAALLAYLISEAMNASALAGAGAVLPFGAWLWLRWKARRREG